MWWGSEWECDPFEIEYGTWVCLCLSVCLSLSHTYTQIYISWLSFYWVFCVKDSKTNEVTGFWATAGWDNTLLEDCYFIFILPGRSWNTVSGRAVSPVVNEIHGLEWILFTHVLIFEAVFLFPWQTSIFSVQWRTTYGYTLIKKH